MPPPARDTRRGRTVFDALTTAADRLNSIDPTIQQALVAFGIAASCASLAAGILIGALWARALR